MIESAVSEAEHVEAFEEFFQMHYERLLRTMYLTTGDRHEGEDLTQDAMARVYERWERVRTLDDPVGYVYRTALNLRRSRIRRLAVALRKSRPGAGASEPTEAVEQRDMLRRALMSLPEGQRQAIVLVEWLEMTDSQAADALRISPGAVRTRASRARAALRDALKGEVDV